MKIIVTGGAGLLGSHLAEYLLEEGHSVTVIDNLSTGLYENIPTGTDFVKMDLRNRGAVDGIVSRVRPEIIYHLAAWAHEGLSQFCPNLILENNLNVSMNMLTASIRHGVKRFVFTSSMAAYGDQNPPFTEDMPTKPVDIYGMSKASFEQSLQILSKVFDFEYSIIRPHNVIGTRQAMHDPYRNVVAIFMNRMLQGKPLYIYGDGEQKRAFSFVNDFTPYLAKAGWLDEAKNEIFNVGADKPYSINELVEALKEVSGEDIQYEYVPDRAQEVDFAWCDHSKARDILGFQNRTSLREGLQIMWAWAKSVGYKNPRYLPKLELVNEKTPAIWVNKQI